MKKIVIAFDNTSFSNTAMDFAVTMNELSPVLLTGVFLPQSIVSTVWSYAESVPTGYFIPGMEPENAMEVKAHVESFKAICEKNGIDYRVHKDFYDFSVPELIRESRFADFVILGSDTFYQHILDKVPNAYIKQVLHDVECPVLLVPDKATFPGNNILSYDGSADSVFAIRQFAYLFSELCNNKTWLVNVSGKEDADIPDKINIEELAARHFSDLEIMRLGFDPKKYFSTWLAEKPASLLVTGAYGRSDISRIFKDSFINAVITDQKVPLFIAHR
jgi:nucleotide-binding universal stress UspA family protein